LAQVEGDKSRGLYMDPAGAQLRFRDLADRWWAAREVELTTAAANRSRLDNHVLPMWGEWPIGRIEHLVSRIVDSLLFSGAAQPCDLEIHLYEYEANQ